MKKTKATEAHTSLLDNIDRQIGELYSLAGHLAISRTASNEDALELLERVRHLEMDAKELRGNLEEP